MQNHTTPDHAPSPVLWRAAGALTLAALLIMGGCRTFTPPAQTRAIHKNDNATVKLVSFEATRRAAYVVANEDGTIRMAAEPPPDAALDASVDATATLKAMLEKVELEGKLSVKVVESIVNLTERTQAIVLMRDAMFRLAEMHVNGVINSDDYLTLYNKALAGAIALAAPDAETAEAMLAYLLAEQLYADASEATRQSLLNEHLGDIIDNRRNLDLDEQVEEQAESQKDMNERGG